MESFELLHSRVIECFIKVKLDMTAYERLIKIEHIGWITEWPSGTLLESVQTREP